jgi:hypothetical protein
MGVILETIFRSRFLMQKKSTNGLYKKLRLSTKYVLQRSLTLEGISIMDSYKLRLYKLCLDKLCPHKLRLYKLRPYKLCPHKLRPYKLRLRKPYPRKLR